MECEFHDVIEKESARGTRKETKTVSRLLCHPLEQSLRSTLQVREVSSLNLGIPEVSYNAYAKAENPPSAMPNQNASQTIRINMPRRPFASMLAPFESSINQVELLANECLILIIIQRRPDTTPTLRILLPSLIHIHIVVRAKCLLSLPNKPLQLHVQLVQA